MDGESHISVGGIAERAEKLEAAQAAEKPALTPPPEAAKTVETPAPVPEAAKTAETPAPAPKVEEKKLPNDPDELRKWNTKVSMELSDVKKQLEALASTLSKASKKEVNWKELAKDPAKLETAIAEDRKQAVQEATETHQKQVVEAYRDLTRSEKERRKHDPAYPRWEELLPKMMSLAANADRRVNFDQHPSKALDQMYDLAVQDNPTATVAKSAAPVAPGMKMYSEAELAAKVEETRKAALTEAQKGLDAEAKGAGVGGMGKGATKGKPSIDKAALWKMPLGDLKAAIQQASEK